MKACMLVRYCNAVCQKNHWATHKKECKRRAAELRDEALFKDPPAKEDCPICFLPMPFRLICCVSLPPATILSVPIYDYAMAHEMLTTETALEYLYDHPCHAGTFDCIVLDSFDSHSSWHHGRDSSVSLSAFSTEISSFSSFSNRCTSDFLKKSIYRT